MHFFLFVIALIPALLFSQAPEFMQQYAQRLGGAVDELSRVVRRFEERAQRRGLDSQGAIALLERNSEPFVRDEGHEMKENIARLERLRRQQEVFSNGNAFIRLASILKNADSELIESTWQSYRAGLQITYDALVFGLIGLLGSWGLLIALVSGSGLRTRTISA